MRAQVNFLHHYKAEGFEDILFQNLNKEYGAYRLRKEYKKRIFIAFLISSSFFVTVVTAPLIRSYLNRGKTTLVVDKIPVIFTPDEVDPDFVPPPPPKTENMERLARFVAPQIVDTMKNETLMASIVDLDNIINDAPPADIRPQVINDAAFDNTEEKPFVAVEENATFNGGDLNDFRTWVQHNIIYPAEASAVDIEGKVIVQFVVNSIGEVKDVKVLRGVHPSIDSEVVKVVSSSPLWSPGRQGGKKVKQLFILPVIFKLAKQ